MIPKLKRGAKIGGLMVYLLGDGDHNEHRDRHIIAGSPTVMRAQWLEHFDGPGDKDAAREVALAVAHEIDIPRNLYGTQVRMKAKPVMAGVGARELGLDVVEPAGKGEKSQMRDAPVWHAVLSLMPGEELSDAKWSEVVNEFMDRMGFTGTPDGKRAQARWAAVRHGHSGEEGEGQDHIHIAASLVREDGSKVSTFDYGQGKAKGDWKRAQEVAGELEREFGLKVLASRHEGGGLSGNSRPEVERARTGTGETERERLRRAVRAIATSAESEVEFVHGLREAGIAIYPRYATGGRAEVTGYSVRLRRDGEEVGPWVGGGKLAGDLNLNALREQQWDDSPEGRQAALGAWMNRTGETSKPGQAARGEGIDAWKRAAAETEQWRERLAQIPHGDRAQWAWMAGQAAGVFAAWSEALEGDTPGAFAAAATELTRSAQVRRATDRWQPPRGTHPNAFGDLAQLLLAHPTGSRPRSHASRGAQGEDAASIAVLLLALMLLLLLAAIAIAVAVARAHRARGELARATAVEHMTRAHLDPVRESWEGELQDRRDQWDRDAADVFTAAVGRRTRKVLGELTSVDEQASSQLSQERLAALADAAEALVPGITEAEAWPALREHLAAIEVSGRDAAQQLAEVFAARELGSADDPAAVLVWRLERLAAEQQPASPQSGSTTPDSATTRWGTPLRPPSNRERLAQMRQEDSEHVDKILAAASGPLTPPTPPTADQSRRKYYSELSDAEKSQRRALDAARAGFVSHDIKPRGWTDELLDAELAHRRTEVALLTADIEDRRTSGGAHTRQVLADNAELSAQAEKIPAAQQARIDAEELAAEQRRLDTQCARLTQELEATGRHKMMARKKLQAQLAEASEKLDDLTPVVTAAQAAAKAAARATGVSVHQWNNTLHEAQEQQQLRRLTAARGRDQRGIEADVSSLRDLQHDLAGVEAEHARRGKLTPAQRERELRIRTQNKTPTTDPTRQPPTPGLGTDLPYQPPDHGRGPDRGQGLGR
ncbi:hypothetical protein AB0L82_43210 [Nocardia sp. NPDC052001]|uniref:relaxase/mobilization nuclease domain-containing protein n=1 Tax=Nocardia sp. NPDC052001 TaxID=3154853 RepID=UPI003435073B